MNNDTKETTWEVPSDVKSKADQKAATIAASRPAAGAASPAPGMSPSAHASLPSRPGNPAAATTPAMSPHPEQSNGTPAPSLALAAPGSFVPGVGGTPFPGHQAQNHMQQQTVQQGFNFDTFEEAEKAFFEMLRRYNVNPGWTWEQVLRTTVTDPAFKALKTLQERKNAFEKYCEDIKRKERELKERSMDRNRPAWRTALGRLSEGDYGMKSWWAWERAAREIKNQMPDVWAMARNDEERRSLWQEYMDELDRKDAARQQELRQSNIEKLASILKNLSLDLSVRFQSATNVIRGTKEWSEDTELQSMDPLDFLIVYEENVKRMEQETDQRTLKEKTERQRQIRKNREAYIALLQELKEAGTIKAGTKWKDVFPVIKEDERFTNMLANPGSTPLELFWDLVDDLDLKVEGDTRIIQNVMSERGVKADPSESFQTWNAKLKDDSRISEMAEGDRELVYQAILHRIAQQAREERRRLDRKMKVQIDDLRYALRDIDPPIEPGTFYEEALPRFQDLPEFKALEDEEGRRSAYERYIKRQAEKREEIEKEKEREKERKKAASASGHHSDTESRTSRRTRHRSRLVDDVEVTSGAHRDSPASPARSIREKEREASPARSSRRDRSRDRDRDDRRRHGDRRSERDYDERDRNKTRESERDRRHSRSHRDRDYDREGDDRDDGHRSSRRSRRDEDDRERDGEGDRRSDRHREKDSKAYENGHRSRDGDRERDRDATDKDDQRRSRRRDDEENLPVSTKEKSTRPRDDAPQIRESKVSLVHYSRQIMHQADIDNTMQRVKLDGGEADKEEGEI